MSIYRKMEKGFIVIQMEKQQAYLVTDMSQVAQLIGVSSRTVQNWFTQNNKMHIQRKWMIHKGYEKMKSARGGKEFKRAPKALNSEDHMINPII